jgi:CheY-like chemotaxis protein
MPADGPACILVVDDDPGLRQMMARALSQEGYRVLTAAGGEEALTLAGTLLERLSLVVTDIRMPDMDGLELAAHLAQLTPSPHVLFVSGYVPLAAGASLPGPFLSKPFSPDALASQVRRLLRVARPSPA